MDLLLCLAGQFLLTVIFLLSIGWPETVKRRQRAMENRAPHASAPGKSPVRRNVRFFRSLYFLR